jgi:uncharacterized integral membrane protein (TIGR00698 family)
MIRILVIALSILCLTPYISASLALILGVATALAFGNPFSEATRKITPRLLSVAIIGMGAGMNLITVASVGSRGFGYTAAGIFLTLGAGFLLKKILRIEQGVSVLISVGTAICGGSAIAAVAPVIRAKNHEISVALGIVFLLNAAALFIFPPLGHLFGLTQHQFGLWSALAIHDTSSVVGATMQYGAEALQVGTTVKLARALWIVPVAFFMGYLFNKKSDGAGKAKKPWFILGFCVTAALVTFIPSLRPIGDMVSTMAKQLLVLTLFLIGLNLTRENLKMVGLKALTLGLSLWIISSVGTLAAIHWGLIQ